jgi:hypothetical protein
MSIGWISLACITQLSLNLYAMYCWSASRPGRFTPENSYWVETPQPVSITNEPKRTIPFRYCMIFTQKNILLHRSTWRHDMTWHAGRRSKSGENISHHLHPIWHFLNRKPTPTTHCIIAKGAFTRVTLIDQCCWINDFEFNGWTILFYMVPQKWTMKSIKKWRQIMNI